MMHSEDPDVALCLQYLSSDANKRASSARNISHIRRVIPALKRGDGVSYNPAKQQGGPFTLFAGRAFAREDDLVEARAFAAARIVPRRPKQADAPLPEGAWCYDASWGWVVDHALGIWNDAKVWAAAKALPETAAALSLDTDSSSGPDSPSVAFTPTTGGKHARDLAPVLAPALKKNKDKDVDPALWAPPPASHQQLRAAAMCMPLREYLKRNKAFKHAGKKQWKAIKSWCATHDGTAWLKSAGLDPLSFHRHHIKAEARGGLDSVFNCAFTPGGANCSFGDRDDEWMRTYVGKQACTISDAHAKWFVAKTGDGPDQELFDHTRFM